MLADLAFLRNASQSVTKNGFFRGRWPGLGLCVARRHR